MELERCYSVLAVSSSLKFNESIRGLLPESRYFPVTVMRRCGQRPQRAAGAELRSGYHQRPPDGRVRHAGWRWMSATAAAQACC